MKNKIKANIFEMLKIYTVILICWMCIGISTEAANKSLPHSDIGVDYILKLGKTIKLKSKYKSAISFKTDNPSVVSVKNGIATARKGGIAVITIKYKNGKVKYVEIGVKTSSYIPNKRGKYYLVGKDLSAGEYVAIRDNRVPFYDKNSWSEDMQMAKISISNKGEIYNSYGTHACFVTLKKGDKISLTSSYLVPIDKVSTKTFSLSSINKNMKQAAKKTYFKNCNTWLKVGAGIESGVYEFTPIKSSEDGAYGEVEIFKQENTEKKEDRVGYQSAKESFRVTLKNGHYIKIANCTIKKIAGRKINEL